MYCMMHGQLGGQKDTSDSCDQDGFRKLNCFFIYGKSRLDKGEGSMSCKLCNLNYVM